MKIELLDYTKNGMDLVARMAYSTRKNTLEKKFLGNKTLSKKEYIKSEEDFMGQLIKMGHLGAFEHITFTFHVSEISRNLTHQLVRHRIASYLQQSNRKVIPQSNDFVIPPTVKGNIIENKFKTAMISAWSDYHEVMEAGIPVEDARYLLPSGYFTYIAITMNARQLRHFFELRCDKHAQWEIREMANKMLKICYEKFLVIFEDLYKKFIEEKIND